MAGYNTQIETPIAGTPFTFRWSEKATIRPAVVYLVVNNQSPFILSVLSQRDIVFLPAFTSDVYELTGNPRPEVIITPEQNTGPDAPLVNRVFGTFYEFRTDLPLATYPAALYGTPEAALVPGAVKIFEGTLTTNVATSEIDVSEFQSYEIQISWQNGTVDTYAPFLFQWETAENDIVWRNDFTVVAEGSANLGDTTMSGFTYITDRMHGDILKIQATFSTGTFSVIVYGSRRPADNLRVVQPETADNVLMEPGVNISLGAGASSSIYWCGPIAGRVLLWHSGSQQYDVNYFMGPAAASFGQENNFTANTLHERELILPYRCFGIQIDNDGGVSGTFQLRLWREPMT